MSNQMIPEIYSTPELSQARPGSVAVEHPQIESMVGHWHHSDLDHRNHSSRDFVDSQLTRCGYKGVDGARWRSRPEDGRHLWSDGIYVLQAIAGLVVGLVCLFGANKMRNLNHTPGDGSLYFDHGTMHISCCVMGLPFGIWSLVVLNPP